MDVRHNKSNKITFTQFGEAVYTINPAELTPDESYVLFVFLAGYLKHGQKKILPHTYYPFLDISIDNALAEKLQNMGINYNQQAKTIVPFYVRLTNAVVWRVCAKNSDGFRYDVYNGNILGSGSFAEIEEIKGTLVPLNNKSFAYKHYAAAEMRVAKKQSEKELTRVLSEYTFYRRFSEFHTKPPTFLSNGAVKSASYMVMRKIPGTCLKSILTDDQSLKHFNKNDITTERRIELTITFLRALARMHRKNVIHRDIKLANVIVDLAPDIIKLAILDFGLSTDILHPDDGRRVGTLLYAPPEMFDNKHQTIKGDIYSAAWVIAMIFRADDNDSYDQDSYDLAYQKVSANSRRVRFYGLFAGITDLDPVHRRMIADVLDKMVSPAPEQRGDIESIVQIFEKILLHRMLKKVDGKHQKDVESAFYAGTRLRNLFDHYPDRTYTSFNLSFSPMNALVREILTDLVDSPVVISTFVRQTGCIKLQGLICKKQIVDRVRKITNECDESFRRVQFLCDQTNTLIKKIEADNGQVIEQAMYVELVALYRKIQWRLTQHELPVTLTTIDAASVKFNKYIQQLEAEIALVCRYFDLRVPEFDIEPVDNKHSNGCFFGLFSYCGLVEEKNKSDRIGMVSI